MIRQMLKKDPDQRPDMQQAAESLTFLRKNAGCTEEEPR
jgi:hypothetical protein